MECTNKESAQPCELVSTKCSIKGTYRVKHEIVSKCPANLVQMDELESSYEQVLISREEAVNVALVERNGNESITVCNEDSEYVSSTKHDEFVPQML